jgi:hypothetical protein
MQTADPAPLKNWSAPLSWQATTPRELEAVKASPNPQLQVPGGATLGVLVAITPCRLVDTRVNMPQPFGSGSSTPLVWTGGSATSIPAPSGSCSLPAAVAYSANITVWPQPVGTILRYLSVCPTGTSLAQCSSVATLTGYEGGTSGTAGIVSNAAVIPANASGSFDVYVSDSTYVIIDVNGYYISPGAIALGAGTATAPSMTFGTDSTTGIYSSGAGTVNIATGGTNRLTVRSDGDLDLTGNIRQNGSLFLHSVGTKNLSVGTSALPNSTGQGNTASGDHALYLNSTGTQNTANGTDTLYYNTSGSYNTASGYYTLLNNTTGQLNTASGREALVNNTTGSTNIGIGYDAGINLTTGDNNIIIGSNHGTAGMANTILIGDGTNQNRVFITGIRGIQTGNSDAQTVVIDSAGQLGTINSSRRFKEDIQRMGEASSRLMELQPVTYRYKQPYADGSKPIDYGLIAEEVETVYPDLVAKGKDGEVQSVQYHKLIPMLLNEMQKQSAKNAQLEARLAALENSGTR